MSELSLYKRRKIMATLAEANPNPTTELEFDSTFQLLVAVLLSAQSTDVGVNKATKPLFTRAPDVYSLHSLGEDNIREAIRTLGLFNNKAKNTWLLCDKLIREFGGEVPRSRAALESLPGVGRKTANVVLNTAFGEPTMAVDTHVFRLAKRLGFAQGNTVEKVEQELIKNIPQQYLYNAHHWLILHGRYVCKARKPDCENCIVSQWCAQVLESS